MERAALDPHDGQPSALNPYPDAATAELATQVRWWIRFQKQRKGMMTANQPEALIEAVEKIENAYKRRIEKALRAHPLWPWLEPMRGLRGPYVAWIIARIRDPRRFPGQQCAEGHYLPAIYEVGTPCPVEAKGESDRGCGRDGVPQEADVGLEVERHAGLCGAPIGAVRRGTGVRSLWHYFGAHVVDGRAPRRKKGQKATWVTEARGILFGPTGIADQIVRHRPDPYGGIYEQQKERLTVARGVGVPLGIGDSPGASRNGNGTEADPPRGIEGDTGLRPFQIETRARTIAAKAFLGDLLMEWKRAMAEAESGSESDKLRGPHAVAH